MNQPLPASVPSPKECTTAAIQKSAVLRWISFQRLTPIRARA